MQNPKKISWRDILGLQYYFQDSFVWVFQREFPKQKEGEAFGMLMNNIGMGSRATAANQNLVLEKGMSEM